MRRLLSILPALALCACHSPSEPSLATLRLQLARAEARWAANGSGNYRILEYRSCECPPEVLGPVRLQVQVLVPFPEGVPPTETVVMTYESTGEPVPAEYRPAFLTVSQLFDHIREAIARRPYQLVVEYDSVRGHPTLISVDYDRAVADDEFTLRITDFEDTGTPSGN